MSTLRFVPALSLPLALLLAGCAPLIAAPPQPASTPTPTSPGPQAGTSASTSIPPQPTAASITQYEAFASGLASVFTKGNICSLEGPFQLEGDALPVSSGFVGVFTPTSSTQGSYTYTNNIVDGACVDSSDGTYEVIFYSLGEGDIIMTGLATRVCGGVTVFSDTTESRIAIREAPGIACP